MPENTSAESQEKTQHFPPVFALIIGIREYQEQEYSTLKGPENDANRFHQFLTRSRKMRVPEENITKLINQNATRDRILEEFKQLAEDPRILAGNAIIIYYAGHGATVKAPNEWYTTQDDIEILCPYDMGVSNDGGEEQSPPSPGIPDITIAHLLKNIAKAKGNNITLILDCCYSAGLNRKVLETAPTIRQIFNPPPIPSDCDSHILGLHRRGRKITYEFDAYHSESESHILLAACGRNEKAQESIGCLVPSGVFTNLLFQVFCDTTIDMRGLTYKTLMHKVTMERFAFKSDNENPGQNYRNQNPHCEGKHVDRLIFTTQTPHLGQSVHTGMATRPSDAGNSKPAGDFLHAGAAHGYAPGALFDIYKIDASVTQDAPLGRLVATDVGSVASKLEFKGDELFEVPDYFHARHSGGGVPILRLFAEEDVRSWLRNSFQNREIEPEQIGIEIVDHVDGAEMKICEADDGSISLQRLNDILIPFIEEHVPHSMPKGDPDSVVTLLASAAHFQAHLKNDSDDKKVRMELHTLKKRWVSNPSPFTRSIPLIPDGANLVGPDASAEIVADGIKNFGVTVYNDSGIPLYLYLFYFDPTMLQIDELYQSPIGPAGSVIDPTLDSEPNSCFAIGHSGSAGSPITFELGSTETIDVGYLKLWATSEPAPFHAIIQKSPFAPGDPKEKPRWKRQGSQGQPYFDVSDAAEKFWCTKVVTVIQKRPPIL